MVKEIVVRRVGGSVAATLPKEMAERYGIEPGERLLAIETSDGILLSPYDPDTAEAIDIGRAAARRYRNALRRLAK